MSGVLTDGFQAEVTLTYDEIIAQEKAGRPFKVDGLRPIQVSKSDVLDIYDADLLLGRKAPTRRASDVFDGVFRRLLLRPGFLSHLRSLRLR